MAADTSTRPRPFLSHPATPSPRGPPHAFPSIAGRSWRDYVLTVRVTQKPKEVGVGGGGGGREARAFPSLALPGRPATAVSHGSLNSILQWRRRRPCARALVRVPFCVLRFPLSLFLSFSHSDSTPVPPESLYFDSPHQNKNHLAWQSGRASVLRAGGRLAGEKPR